MPSTADVWDYNDMLLPILMMWSLVSGIITIPFTMHQADLRPQITMWSSHYSHVSNEYSWYRYHGW
jgi:hypothetical protein